jgi:hypothetical protein
MTAAAGNDPKWFSDIQWATPCAVETLRRGAANRDQVPRKPGVYAFTLFDGAITLGNRLGVLYVGKATTLRSRMKSYMVDPAVLSLAGRNGEPNTSLKHAGKVGVLVQIQQRSRGTAPSGIFYRWAVTRDEAEARRLELLLLDYLRPGLNTADL